MEKKEISQKFEVAGWRGLSSSLLQKACSSPAPGLPPAPRAPRPGAASPRVCGPGSLSPGNVSPSGRGRVLAVLWSTSRGTRLLP